MGAIPYEDTVSINAMAVSLRRASRGQKDRCNPENLIGLEKEWIPHCMQEARENTNEWVVLVQT